MSRLASEPSTAFRQVRPAHRLPLVRWAGLFLLLLGELLMMTVRFDAGRLPADGPWWVAVLRLSSLLPQVGIAVVVATLVFGWRPLWEDLRRHASRLARPRHGNLFLLGHLTAFAGLVWATARAFEGDALASAYSGLWFGGWVALALATWLLWAATAVPPALWPPGIRHHRRAIAFGTAAGVVACGLGVLVGGLWLPLGRLTLHSVHATLRLLVPDAVCQPDTFHVGTSAFAVYIAPACSGYQGIGMVCGFWPFTCGSSARPSASRMPCG